MSDTPRTDGAVFVVFSSPSNDVEAVDADFARELERENAALRADRDRIDWILSDDGGFFIWWNYDIEEWTPQLKATRDWIDIVMKEAQP